MILFNDELLAAADVALPLPNRGLQFNDGFFETLVWADEAIRYLPHHWHRLHAAARVLDLPLPPALASPEALTRTVRTLTLACALPTARVRIQLWRGGGGLYTPPPLAATEFVATALPFLPNDTPVARADVARTIQSVYSPFSFCKGPHALYYVRAGQERQARALDELVLLDAAGHVAETVSAALFWYKAGTLYTPALTTGCVAGVRRAHILRVAHAHGLPCQEGQFPLTDLLEADLAFTANVAGLRLVQTLGSTTYAAHHALLASMRQWEATPPSAR